MFRKYSVQPILGDHKEVGVYNSNSWRAEAKIQFESSLELRHLSNLAKKDIERSKAVARKLDREIIAIMKRRRGLAKSSLLLLGYSLELSLKSGVVSLFMDMPRKYLKDSLKSRFSHRLVLISRFIELPISKKEEELLDLMEKLVIADARYPITPSDQSSFRQEFNMLGKKIVDDELFEEGCVLFRKIIKHCEGIKGTERFMVTHGGFTIGSDGAFACRLGGEISNRILVSYSSEQKNEGDNNALKLWKLIQENAENNFTLMMLFQEGIDNVKVYEI